MLSPILVDFTKVEPVKFIPRFKKCTPKILVYTDGLSFSNTDFGLTEFLDALTSTTIHGMTPIVKTALRFSGNADFENFTFSTSNFKKSKYDVLFLFGFATGNLPASERDAISKFMQDGGGVFATGDHATLGQRIGGQLPRIKHMRYWNNPDVPSRNLVDRITTNHPGVDNQYQFEDQSDSIPQRLYPKYYYDPVSPNNLALSKPHYLLQHPTKAIIEVFPDHPHEGECVEPVSLTTTFSLDGITFDEFPESLPGVRPAPEVIAKSMSSGGGFPGKHPVSPREFGAICAYDGHDADVGRAVTDATWHHFINVNLIPNSDGPGLDADSLDRVKTYFRNIAEWLMPKTVRYCSIYYIVDWATWRYPLREFLLTPITNKGRAAKLARNIEMGQMLEQTLAHHMTPAAIAQFKEDIVDSSGSKLLSKLRKNRLKDEEVPFLSRKLDIDGLLSQAATGAAVEAMFEQLEKFKTVDELLKEAGSEEKALKQNRKKIDASVRTFAKSFDKAIEAENIKLKK